MSLSQLELERYDRQLKIIGVEGQEKLKKSRVLVVGAGGLGSPVLLYLAAAGVGELVVVDDGLVELSNLNRQILYRTSDIGKPKVDIAFERLRELNPHVKITPIHKRADKQLLEELVPSVDLVIDALDNWETRFILNEICVKHRKPLIHAGVYGLYGQLLVVIPGITPCLQCLLPRKPAETTGIPVLGPTPGVLGALQAVEAIKILTGYGKPALNKLVVYDGVNGEFTTLQLSRNPKCPVCSGL